MRQFHATVTRAWIPTNEEEKFLETMDNAGAVDTIPFGLRVGRRQRRNCRATTIRRRSIDVILIILSLLLMSPNDQLQNTNTSKRRCGGWSILPLTLALLPQTKSRERNLVGRIKASLIAPVSSPSLLSDATTSPLFSNRIHTPSPTKFSNPLGQSGFRQHHRASPRKTRRNHNPRSSFLSPRSTSTSLSSLSSPTALHMVLTTPEAIIEQASTVNLLDDLIDESVRTSARRPIMMQFDPSSGWIWRRWTGTVFAETWTSCARNMIFALAVYMIHRSYPHIFKDYLSGFNTLWGQLLSVTTFTLTFFVNQSYALWRKCMELSRRLQGRLHDIGMNMASHAERVVPSNPNEKSTYTTASRQILELMSRYVRLFNLLTYASFTRSHRPILTPRGLRRLVERGLLTAQEREVLVDAVIPATQRHSVVLMWMIRLFIEGRASGHIQGGHGFESETMHKFHIIRSQYGAIGDELQGRMPLAYAHIVQVLVDLILWMFPIMAFSTGMSPLLVVFGTGLLTVSYQGLFDLAKQFLDPYDNENYGRGEDPLCVDTLIAETNAGSIRWLYGFEELPFSSQRLNDGELYEYLLPVRGYSLEELDEMEKERSEREKQLEEQRKREDEEAAAAAAAAAELERLRKEAEEREAEAEEQEAEVEEQEAESEKIDADTHTIEDEELIDIDIGMENNVTAAEFSEIVDALATELPVPGDDNAVESIDAIENKTIPEIEEQIVSSVIEVESNVTQSSDSSSEVSVDNDESPSKETMPVHTVTTLATDGSLISSFKPVETAKPVVVEEPVPSGMLTSNYLATLKMQNERIKSLIAAADLEETELEEDEMDFEAYADLPWFDEVGSDGQEFRLSQELADEVWVEDTDDVQIKNMTREEYEERLKEIEENAEIELKETIEVMSAIPGAETAETLYTVTERRKKKAPIYDQTRLDGISQLWGLPPEDPAALSVYEPPEKIDDVDFGSISQLWGGSGLSESSITTSSQNTRQDESEVVGMGSFAGISELWGPAQNDFQDEIDGQEINPATRNETDLDSNANGEGAPGDYVGASFGGLPWHNEKGPDGQEYRLSEMLADEEWMMDSDAEDYSPMTLDDYNEQVREITEKLEEELRETEAILLSKPGADPLGWDYDDEQLTPMSNVTNTDEAEEEEDIGDKNTTIIEDADLAVLEMDVEVEEELIVVEDENEVDVSVADSDAPITAEDGDASSAVADADIEASGDLGDNEPRNGVTVESESALEEETIELALNTKDFAIAQSEASEIESEESDETTNNDGKKKRKKNMIEPIFLEDENSPSEESEKNKIEAIFLNEEESSLMEDGDEEDDLRL